MHTCIHLQPAEDRLSLILIASPVNTAYTGPMEQERVYEVAQYRNLTRDEIRTLEIQGCSAESWELVVVPACDAQGRSIPFDTARLRNLRCSGSVRIGILQGFHHVPGGVNIPAGLYDASLHNVVVGNDVLVSGVQQYIANYTLGDSVRIQNIERLAVTGPTAFGNGTRVRVINEGGGREIPIYDGLTAQIAYLIALYRHHTIMIEKLEAWIAAYTRENTSDMGTVGDHAIIDGCRVIENLRIGPWARLQGAGYLSEGTIRSCEQDPAAVGLQVYASHFIQCEGSTITENVIVSHCFIGQATELAKQYSAEHSVFFANCGGYHGEACSIFAGPFTITHHKATLLIAGYFSFLNAGSGSNQSNHMYKLGPNHQGIVERGSKTASDSYMLWPMRVGAFTLIMGRHYGNSDTTDLPFSYLIEHDGSSLLVPAVNLRSIGTIRDSRKWPKRDRRRAPDRLDAINFHLLTPYTVSRMVAGCHLLRRLQEQADPDQQLLSYQGVKIQRSAVERGIHLYELAITRYLGNVIVQHLFEAPFTTLAEIHDALRPAGTGGKGIWVDLAGLIAPKELVDTLVSGIEQGDIVSLCEVDTRFRSTFDEFEGYELAWVNEQVRQSFQVDLTSATAGEISVIIERWIAAVTELDELRCLDAEKEFSSSAKIGYGIDGTREDRDQEHRMIHGTIQDTESIREIRNRLAVKQRTAEKLLQRLNSSVTT